MNVHCQSREQTLPSCTKFQLTTTTSVLKLLHMNLAGTKGGEALIEKSTSMQKLFEWTIAILNSPTNLLDLSHPYLIRNMNSIQMRIEDFLTMEKQVKEGSSYPKKWNTFSLRGLTNSFNDTTHLEKLEVWTIPIIEHPTLKDVLTMGGMSQDVKELDNEFIMSSKDSLIRNQLFITTSCLNGKYV